MTDHTSEISHNTFLVTGSAGFIGYHVARTLLDCGARVVGLDNFNDYYSPALKHDRDRELRRHPNFVSVAADLTDLPALEALFEAHRPRKICHLAAQAGVRYSLVNPFAYQKSNLEGFLNLLELARRFPPERLVYASSSSVYAGLTETPFTETQRVDTPISLYAATKKANELMAHAYMHLFGLHTVGLRFFTVYGPWGRPDMALFLFTKAILAGEPVKVFNFGKHSRSFTYVDDIVEGVVRVIDRPAQPDPAWTALAPTPSSSNAPYRIYNIGNNQPVKLMRYIEVLEQCLGRKAILDLLPLLAHLADTEDPAFGAALFHATLARFAQALAPATASAPAGSRIERVSSNTSLIAAQIASVSTSTISSTYSWHRRKVSAPTYLTAAPSAKRPTDSRRTRLPALSDRSMASASAASTPSISSSSSRRRRRRRSSAPSGPTFS